MPDTPSQPGPAAPTPGEESRKKATTRLIVIPLAESRPEDAAPPKTIPLKRSVPTAHGPPPADAPGIQPGPLPGRSKQETMRIELDDVLGEPPPPPADRRQVTMPISEMMVAETPAPAVPDRRNVTMPISELMTAEQPESPPAPAKPAPAPVQTVKRPAAFNPDTIAAAGKKTTRLDLEPVADTPASKEAKRATSPITVIPQTIRLKRASGLTQALPPPKARTDVISEAPTIGRMPDLSQAKMTTARVILEPDEPAPTPAEGKRRTSVIGGLPAAGEPTPPTIHLKRPSSGAEAPTVVRSAAAETDLTPAAEPTAITQRKTIKIKRTERNVVAPRTVKLQAAQSAVGTVPAAFGRAPSAVPADDSLPGPLFLALASVAAVLVAGLVYFLAAQAFGPDLVLPVPASLL